MKTIPSEMRVGSVPPGMKNGFLVDDELNFGIIADGKLYSIKLSPAEATRMALSLLAYVERHLASDGLSSARPVGEA